jgi:hypothetical protein
VKRRFILQAIHPEYACPAFETMFETERLHELRALLGPDAPDDPDFEKHYWLEPADLVALAGRFGIQFDAEGREVLLYERGRLIDDCPYLPHTNYELPLLLEGRKKLARMYFEYPPNTHHPYEEPLRPLRCPGTSAQGSRSRAVRQADPSAQWPGL